MAGPRQSGGTVARCRRSCLRRTRTRSNLGWEAEIWSMRLRKCVSLALLVLFAAAPADADPLAPGAASGLPVPRFVSLKSDRVNVRGGPDKDHEVVWVFTRSALPVEITAEFDNWRRIRDQDGAEGWVYHSLLSGKRTALVEAKHKSELVGLFAGPDAHSRMVARLEPG